MKTQDSPPSFLFLAASTPWVYALAQSLEAYGPVTAVRFMDWRNDARLKPQWPETSSGVKRVHVSMPQGYAGTLEPVFRPLMRHIVERERSALARVTGKDPHVVCPYPYLAPWVRQLDGKSLVYYNLDDYALYDLRRRERITALEDELVARARLSICLSRHQVDELRRRHPSHAHKIRHFPLGVTEAFLNPHPRQPPLPDSIGYIGNMTDRLDWASVRRVVEAMPDHSFHFVGDAAAGDSGCGFGGDAWRGERAKVLAMPNVVAVGAVPQSEVRRHYWNYAVNWMPYDPRHPFNIASCPTKIMDALASGRPFLSTDIPESRLYPERVHIAADAADAARKLRVLAGAASHDSQAQVDFARRHTWTLRAREFLELLGEQRTPAARSAVEAS